jgi:hypothetical protein
MLAPASAEPTKQAGCASARGESRRIMSVGKSPSSSMRADRGDGLLRTYRTRADEAGRRSGRERRRLRERVRPPWPRWAPSGIWTRPYQLRSIRSDGFIG